MTEEDAQEAIKELPRLTPHNSIAFSVYGILKGGYFNNFNDAVEFLQLEMNRTQRYILLKKVFMVETMIQEEVRRQHEAAKRKAEVEGKRY